MHETVTSVKKIGLRHNIASPNIDAVKEALFGHTQENI